MQESVKIPKQLNHVDPKTATKNFIRTSRYTWYSFLPLFLFEQYKQVNNIYYLLNAIAGYIVVIVSPMSNVLPIIFVLVMAAIREIIEDCGRHKSDAQQNATQFKIIRNGVITDVTSKDICEGDLLILKQRQEVPCDCILLSSSLESGLCYVSTANLDGEINLKSKAQILSSKLQEGDILKYNTTVTTPLPEDNMQSFIGSIIVANEQKNFNLNNVLLRGMRLENTELVYCGVIFAGKNTRLMQTQVKARVKSSRMNNRMNKLILYQAMFSISLMLIFPGISGATLNNYHKKYVSFDEEPFNIGVTFIEKFIIYFILLAYLLPVSLYVSLEFTRLINAMQFESDKRMKRDDLRIFMENNKKTKLKDTKFDSENVYALSAQVKNSICVENLQEVDIIFSDKTGTLTKNQMLFHSFSDQNNFKNEVYGQIREELNNNFQYHRQYTNFDLHMLFQLALCNTVQVQVTTSDNKSTSTYQGESPDEIAFCNAAKTFGLKLSQRNATSVEYQINIQDSIYNMKFEVLAVVPFSSDRKKMSIVLQEVGQEGINQEQINQLHGFGVQRDEKTFFLPVKIAQPGQPFILTKGADSFMLPLCNITKQNIDIIQKIASEYSVLGLRTLVFGCKQLQDPEWLKEWNMVSNLKESDPQYYDCTKKIECDLQYSGMTAIEDELQDELHDTLSFSIQAGIRIWMLTGDKTETAVNIAKSSGLAPIDSKLLYLTSESVQNSEILKKLLLEYIDFQKNSLTGKALSNYELVQKSIQLQSHNSSKTRMQKFVTELLGYFYCKGLNKQTIQDSQSGNNTTLVMDSKTYNMIRQENLENEFYTIAFHSQSAVCCRLSPSEKAQIIKRTHDLIPEFTTLAIGDGANDVAMIKEAQIGVGVAGKEGVHSCNNADITIPEFKFLKPAIFIHGRFMHIRNQEIFEYMIEKNSILAIMHVVYSFYNLFTIQVYIDSLLLLMFNLQITLLPIFFQAMVEQDVNKQVLLTDPQIFRKMFTKFRPSGWALFLRMLRGIYYSIVIVCLGKYLTQNQITFNNGTVNDLNSQAFSVFLSILFATSIELFLHQNYYTVFMLGAFIYMIVVTAICMWFGNSSQMFGIMLIGVTPQVQGSLFFHLSWILQGLVCVIPSITYEVLQKLYWPSLDDIVRHKTRKSGCDDPRQINVVQQQNSQEYTKIIQIAQPFDSLDNKSYFIK
ncbi:Phospholipid-translocating_ATPase [Hexamita inflata]|uniref:Phospholipid-translocating_ATPase n=1 Tax=Hexamita inflata TaxID=28002 RepID=A0ABP1H6Q6_9EUKA